MGKDLKIPLSVEELREELTTLKLKIALQEYREKALDDLVKRHEADENLEKAIASSEGKMMRQIADAVRRMHIRQFMRRTLPKAGKTVACVLLVFYVGLSFAIAAVPSVRVSVMNFIVNIEERYTSFGFEDTGEAIEVPENWAGYYYPSYIPEGYVLSDILGGNIGRYVGANGAVIEFSDMSSDTYGHIDTENALVDFTEINGRSALLVEKGEWVTILWNIDNRVLMINSYSGTLEETIKIAESVRMIKT